MREVPFRQKPSFRSLILAVVLVGIYVYNLVWQGGIWQNVLGIVFDLVLLALLYQVAVFFYAQFILPVRTLEDRKKVASRLPLHAGGGHGPALFVKNGRLVERSGEAGIRGPGVLWVDTASAVVTRTFTTFKQVLGPGVHFIEGTEQIASIISLHTQSQTIGPVPGDLPFERLRDGASEDERQRYEQMRSRCMAVRAMTRDGIEVIPTISVTFKIDARPAGPGERGSHFGFNAEAVERAARSEGINPNSMSDDRRRVAWNQLPALMAAELWREYLSKFTLSELFDPSLKPLPDVRQPEPPRPPAPLPKTPLVIKRGFPSRILRNINNAWEKKLDQLIPKEELPAEDEIAAAEAAASRKPGAGRRTALQIINQMMKARLSQALVPQLDDCGRLVDGVLASEEYKKLKERGIAVLGASVGALYLDPSVETQLLHRWTTSWLSNARAERNRIERLNLAYAEQGKQAALLDQALALSDAFNKAAPGTLLEAVKVLIQGTTAQIRTDDRLLGRSTSDLEALENISKWLETKEP